MPIAATAMVLVAALLHVAWNAIVKTSGDPLQATSRAVWLGTAAATPFVVVGWLVTGRPTLTPDGWILATVSSALEVVYWILLGIAYRRGGLSAVYPVARGSAAVLGAAIGLGLLGEQLSGPDLAAVGLLVAGTVSVASAGASIRVIGPALALGGSIAAYTLVDRFGVRTGPTWLYGWTLFALGGAMLAVVLRLAPARLTGRRSTAATRPAPGSSMATDGAAVTLPDQPPPFRQAMAAGLLMVGVYALVLTALAIAPLAGVAPLRESATVLAAAWGVIRLGERDGAARRLAGAALIAVGAIVLAISP